MKSLEYTEDFKLSFDKTYLLVRVDDCLNSQPFINTGENILKYLLQKLVVETEEISDIIVDAGFEENEFTQEEFTSLYNLLSEKGFSLEDELNELGYSIYNL